MLEAVYLTGEQICILNHDVITLYGGYTNAAGKLRNSCGLSYLVEAVQASIFGLELYPNISSKAAFYTWYIIRSQPFYDGNKRTGLLACRVFLNLNNWFYREALTTEEGKKIALDIATGIMSLDDIAHWLDNKLVKRSFSVSHMLYILS